MIIILFFKLEKKEKMKRQRNKSMSHKIYDVGLEEKWEKENKKRVRSIDLYTYIYICPIFWL